MKKKTNKIIISLIIVFVAFILGTVFGQEVKAADYTIPIHYHEGKENWKLSRGYKITRGSEQKTVIKDKPNIGITQVGKGADPSAPAYKKIVSQNNIFCIQRGKKLSYSDKYKISDEKKITSSQNPAFAYLLCNGGNSMSGSQWYENNQQQQAIWNYIKVNNGKIPGYGGTGIGGEFSSSQLYKNAIAYSNNYKAYSPKVDLKVNGTTIQATYGGTMGNNATIELYVEGVKKETKTVSNKTGNVTFTKTTYDATKSYECKLISTRTEYTAIYYILYSNGEQDLLAVLHTEKKDISKTVNDTMAPTAKPANISMQKYISKVNDEYVYPWKLFGGRETRENWISKAEDLYYIHRDPSKDKKREDLKIKYKNPVEIDAGDKVTYVIEVYNNNTEGESCLNASIIDRIPYDNEKYLIDILNSRGEIDKGKIEIKDATHNQKVTTWDVLKEGENAYYGLIKIGIGELKPNSSVKIEITMRFNQDYSSVPNEKIENTAWLSVTGNKTDYRTADRDYVSINPIDVSMQKYIIEAEGAQINNRSNLYSSEEDKKASATATDKYGVQYSEYKKATKKSATMTNEYKYNKAVSINTKSTGGVSVKYRIEIYNNSEKTVNTVVVNDFEPKSAIYESIDGDGAEYNNGIITINKEIPKRSSTYVDVTYKFSDQYSTGDVIDNTAKIISANGSKIESDYRTADRDYVKISTSSVGLEKTVYEIKRKDKNGTYQKVSLDYTDSKNDDEIKEVLSKIPSGKDKNGNDISLNVATECDFDGNGSIDTMDGFWILQYSVGYFDGTFDRYIEGGIEEDSGMQEKVKIYNNLMAKQANATSFMCGDLNRDHSINSADALLLFQWITYGGGNVPIVEVGDLVTYNIEIKNTGNGDIYVKDFYERPANYLEFYSISGYSATCTELSSKHKFGKVSEVDGYDYTMNATQHITFNKQKIAEGKSINLKITYKVVVPKENTKDSQSILNKAGIEKIYDAKDNEISDVDDVINNISSVSVVTKIYSVKLTKYVSKVKSKDDTEAHGLETKSDKVKYNSTLAIDRKTYPIYGEYNYKKDYKVMVEPGDEVTFTVKVTNTGTDSKKYGKVRTTNITEAFDNELEYVSCSGDGSYNSDKKEITLNNNVFDVNQSAEINIIFRVKVEGDKTKEQVELTNTASIGEIKNVNDMDVEDKDGTENNKDADYLKTKVYQVKLVKYITSVKSKDDTEAHSIYNTPNNPKHNTTLTAREGNPIYINTEKENKKVMVEPGDEVTYKIKVVNTGSNNEDYGTVKVAQLIDTISDSNKLQLQRCTIGSTNYTLNSALNQSINPNSTLEITAIFKVNVTGDDTKEQLDLDNQAEIKGFTNRNDITVVDKDGTKNNKDADYLKTKVYQVKLVKYIKNVKSKDDTEAHQIITNPKLSKYNSKEKDRENNPIYENNKKETNKVMVEPGDEVTYKIKVVNTGSNNTDYGTIKVAQLIDTIGDSNKLQLQSCNIGDTRYTLNSAFNKSINPNSTLEITAVFKVNVTGDNTKEQWELDNQAEIQGLENRNDITVVDRDGTKNNKDADYLKTKVYQVKLVKYIASVKSKDEASRMNTDKKDSKYNTTLTNRENNPTHNNNKAKENNRVMVEPGDEVTFKIKITNTGANNENYGMINAATLVDSINDSNKLQLIKCTIAGEDYNLNNRLLNKQIEPNNTIELTAVFKINVTGNDTKQKWELENQAEISNLKNRNDVIVGDKDGTENNKDADYLLTKTYAVKLEKVVNTVYINGDFNRQLKPKDTTKENFKEVRFGRPEHCDDNNPATNSDSKEKDPVTVVTNDIVEYSIIITNEANLSDNPEKEENACNSAIRVGEIIDTLPDGVELIGYFNENGDKVNTKYFKDILIKPEESKELKVRVKVTEDKMSLNILKNIAEIEAGSLTNRNENSIQDTTENNNKDADYIQLNYKHDDIDPKPGDDDNIFFAGTVWNDMAPDKESEYYNTIMDNSERKLSGIKVDLYRNSYKKENNEMDYTPITKTIVATTITDENGNYSFGDQDIHLENQRENYIKGPKISNEDNRWAGYYGYYIVFTYDGITYTSTNNGIYFEDIYNSTKDYTKDSNASEYNVNESEISGYTTRKDFNSKFATINNSTKIQDKEIQYDRVNESGYIPESTYKYDPEIMSMKSLTKEIDLSTFMGMGTDKCLERSKYIGLGLRGRDIFDLELTSDVSKVEVKVNGITGTYDYTNKIGVRRGDVEENYYEDMANKYISKMKEDYVGDLNGDKGQQIRQTDVKDIESIDTARGTPVTNYNTNQLLQNIFVTYKITVTNASETKTDGRSTKVINYFDRNYKNDSSHISVKGGSINEINSYGKYNSVLIDATSDEIYITYELDNARDKLKTLESGQLKTYNMAEIYEYTTTQYGDKDERTYTKGILDKDSAPGSVETEKASLTGKTFSEDTTLDYYFKGENLDKLKYEDDTYATPTLYFTTPGSIRLLSGTVFEDYTVVTDDRVRTGDGIQNSIEPGIEGAKVQLLEGCSKETYDAQTDTNLKYKQGRSDYYVVRYQTTTDKNGEFKFTNYLPGNYIMRYFYGDNQETFYIGNTNTKSYNGEDFQATNNSEKVDDADVHFLSTIEDYWYTYNYDEGVSTATDIADMRKQVSTAACELSDDEMELLNNVRDGKVKVPEAGKREDGTISSLRDKLDMQAKTKQFTLTVEKSIKGKQNDEFDVYEVNKMNFGIAEVPVTTIDLQKHVNLFEIKDSTGENTIASAEITDTYIVEINKHNITDENKYNKVKAALKNADITGYTFDGYSTDKYGDKIDNENTTVNDQVNKIKVDKLRGYLITYSIPNIITITPTWKTVGNVLPGVKATNTVLDVSIEDAKLQGAKLQIKYDIAVSMYAEKDFSGTDPLQPSIDKVIDLIDNGVSYSDLLNSEGQWKVANASELKRGDSDPSETSGLESYPSTEFTTTIIESDSSNELLAIRAGYTESTSVTVERVLTSQDTSIQDIITSSIDAFEYQNTVKILQLDYTNSKVKIDGEEIKNKDRIRTPERYIIVPGKHHDSARSETIAIHPPTGDTSTHTMYYIIGAAGLAVLAIGAFGIKKFVLKCKGIKK